MGFLDTEREQFKNVHCHCGVDRNSQEKHSTEETAGGRADLAATAAAHSYSLLSKSLSSLSTPPKRESNTIHTPEATVILYHIYQDIMA